MDQKQRTPSGQRQGVYMGGYMPWLPQDPPLFVPAHGAATRQLCLRCLIEKHVRPKNEVRPYFYSNGDVRPVLKWSPYPRSLPTGLLRVDAAGTRKNPFAQPAPVKDGDQGQTACQQSNATLERSTTVMVVAYGDKENVAGTSSMEWAPSASGSFEAFLGPDGRGPMDPSAQGCHRY
ncbi:hypothetical protein LIA77_01173 [Sarocladium implicatum]|nr:hypothetical protein LIA77_01173 [Sarocladium implicatum]